jgi:peptidoglycan-N-acetylglucosamine deacetylase
MRLITLSFDNGPDPDVTPLVLDVLAKHGLRASFFVLGEKLLDRKRRAASERAHNEGHWIGNHTFSHVLPLGRSRDADIAPKEIGRTQELLADLAHEDRLFRPFGGRGAIGTHLLSRGVLQYLIDGKYTCVLWNIVPGDWEDAHGWVERAVDQCARTEWALVVLHDLPTGAMDNLEHFIGLAREGGATFCQEFPPSCVPLVRGQVVSPMDDYVADAAI